jgi:hypothetical protein
MIVSRLAVATYERCEKVAAIRSTGGERQVSGVERSSTPANPDRPVWAAADIRPRKLNGRNQSEAAVQLCQMAGSNAA